MIRETLYKDRPAIELSCSAFSALFLPRDGAKLTSFRTKEGMELLAQTQGAPYRRLQLDSDYEQSECSAFDDMFPAIDPCVICGLVYLDHGEVCRREHQVQLEGDGVTFSCLLPSLHIRYQKTAWCEDGALCIRYRIENQNDFDFPYVWAGHIMVKGEEGAYVVSNLPPSAPITVLDGDPDTETAHILPKPGKKNYKFYYTEAQAPLQCGVVFPKSKTQLTAAFDNQVVKYLGVWVNPGDLNGMYTMALEPCTALFDNPVNAEKANAASYIKAHQKAEFVLKLSYKNLIHA